MAVKWTLLLQAGTGDPTRRVGGLNLPLRSSLAAAKAGASNVVIQDNAIPPQLLADSRLAIPVSSEAPSNAQLLAVRADEVVHPHAFRIAARALEQQHPLSVDEASQRIDSPFGFQPVRVVDPRSARRAEKLLFRALRKPEDGWTARWLNRYISLALSRWLVRTPLSPNQVSVGILAIGLAGAWLASRGSYASMLAGAVLFQAQSVLDGCDGEMSRVTYRTSLRGEWMDTIGDDITNYAFFGCAAWGLSRTVAHPVYAIAGIVTVCAGVTASLLEYRYLIAIGSGDLLKYPGSYDGTKASGLSAAVAPLFKRDTFVFLTLIAAILGWVGPMLVVFAIGALGLLINVLKTELQLARSRREAGDCAR